MLRRALLLLLLPAPALAQDQLEDGLDDALVLENVLTGLDRPTAAEFLPDGRILFVAQNSGDVFVYDEATDLPPTNVGRIPIQSGGSERGLLGVAIDPQFTTSGRVYFYYSFNNTQRVAWIPFDAQMNSLDIGAAQVVIDGLASNANHNGGGLRFGPDGMLYVGVGDTGCNCNCAPGTNTSNYFGTCLTNLNGKILRVTRNGAVPDDGMNGLVGETGVADCVANRCAQSVPGTPRAVIYNWGFRNPWRFAFDDQTGHLWIGDVGELTWEEITVSTGPNQHHGWPYREGAEGQPASACASATPQSGDCKDPAFAYPGQGSVTGGVFANHCSWPAPWRGRYFFGGYVQNRTWYLQPNAARDGVDGDRVRVVRHGSGGGPVHYFVGPTGAIYFVTLTDGEIWRLRPANPIDCGPPDAGVRDGGGGDGGDAGAREDGGSNAPARDAGARDAGADDGLTPADGERCSCASTERSGAPWGIAIVALWIWRRRR